MKACSCGSSLTSGDVLHGGGSPIREGAQIKQRHCVAVDGDTESDHAEEIHHEARFHHVDCGHGAVTKHDGIGGRGDWQSEGIRADNSCRKSQVDGVDAHGDRQICQDWDENICRGRV